jgi:hypothetical protein
VSAHLADRRARLESARAELLELLEQWLDEPWSDIDELLRGRGEQWGLRRLLLTHRTLWLDLHRAEERAAP